MSILDIIKFVENFVVAIGGISAFAIYFWQKNTRKKESAALIVMQIQDLKDKILDINDIASNDQLNATEFYETLDIITDNQWEKYRHLFIMKIDSHSYRTINKFYDCALSIREQLLFVKHLQHSQYMNIQGMLDNNCNTFILDTMNKVDPNLLIIQSFVNNQNTKDEEYAKIKGLLSNTIDNMINSNANQSLADFHKIYDSKLKKIKDITNSNVYVDYIPKQVYITLSKRINEINSIEVEGCSGFKVLEKIAKIK